MAIATRTFFLHFFRAAALAADMTKFALGDEVDPDLPDPELDHDGTAMNVSPQEGAGWLFDLVRLDEELEHICVFGLLDPMGSTRLLRQPDRATAKKIHPSIAMSLAFFKEVLDSVAGVCEADGLWRRLQEEINEALKGPGYQFGELRETLYEALRLSVPFAAETEAHREDEDGEHDDAAREGEGDEGEGDEDEGDEGDEDEGDEDEESEEDEGDEDEESEEGEDYEEDEEDEDEEDEGEDDDNDDSGVILVISRHPMVSRALNLLAILRVPFEQEDAIEICVKAVVAVESAMKEMHPLRSTSGGSNVR